MNLSGRELSRKEMLKLSALGGAALALPLERTVRFRNVGRAGDFESPRRPPFQIDMPIPSVLQPVRRDATTDFYQVTQRAATAEVIPGITTPIWGYEGTMPGPTIMARKGRRVSVTHFNRLPPDGDPKNIILSDPQDPEDHPFRNSSTVVHQHGINSSQMDDSYPETTILPGQQFTHTYPNNDYQRPATLWYHDHSIHLTGEHLYRGLEGFYILTDDFEDELPLPKGEFDVPLSLKDVILDRSGVLVYDNQGHKGLEGDVQTVNGVQQPRFAVANRKYRFRMLDASDDREYDVALSDDSPITMIGSDQGLLERPVNVRSFRITPSERYEVIIDFSRYPIGARVVMENRLVDPDSPVRRIMAFDVTRRASDDSRVPSVLRPIDPIPASAAVRTRNWEFERQGGYWSINGKQWDENRVDAFPKLDTVEIWNLVNGGGGWSHPVHIHLVRFLILSVEGRKLQPYERGWKDTVRVGPNQSARVIMEFKNFAGKFVMHCHNSSHEDHDMMTQFETMP